MKAYYLLWSGAPAWGAVAALVAALGACDGRSSATDRAAEGPTSPSGPTSPAATCGDAICEEGETCIGCPEDCGACSTGSCCATHPGGCGDVAVRDCVMAKDSRCGMVWDPGCVWEVSSLGCGACPNGGAP